MHTIGVSIAIPAPFGAELQHFRRSFGDPMADTIPTHVTLLPPTAVSDDLLPTIREHLESVAAQAVSFPMTLRGTGSFRPVSSVIFVQVAAGIAECERLELAVRQGPLARELRFRYHPHVTVAHDLPAEAMDHAFDELAAYSCVFEVGSFDLYEHGADQVWRSVAAYRFGGANDH